MAYNTINYPMNNTETRSFHTNYNALNDSINTEYDSKLNHLFGKVTSRYYSLSAQENQFDN